MLYFDFKTITVVDRLHLVIVLKSKLFSYNPPIVLRLPLCSYLYSTSFQEILLKLHNFMQFVHITPFCFKKCAHHVCMVQICAKYMEFSSETDGQRVLTTQRITFNIFYKLDKTASKLNLSADEVEGLNSKSDVLHKID